MSYQSIPDFAEQEDTQAVFDLPSSLKAQFFRRIPIFVAVLLFLTAVAGTRHSPTTSSMTSFAATSLPELRADCLSRDYGPVKEGYDLVAYQSIEPGPNVPGVKGNPLCNSTYEGYILWFSSASNKEIFDANPSKYMPNLGGFCAYGIAVEEWWNASNLGPPGNPDQWEIINGSLFFFKSATVREMFMGTLNTSFAAKNTAPNSTELLALARARWDGWFGDVPAYNTAPSEICACPFLPGKTCA